MPHCVAVVARMWECWLMSMWRKCWFHSTTTQRSASSSAHLLSVPLVSKRLYYVMSNWSTMTNSYFHPDQIIMMIMMLMPIQSVNIDLEVMERGSGGLEKQPTWIPCLTVLGIFVGKIIHRCFLILKWLKTFVRTASFQRYQLVTLCSLLLFTIYYGADFSKYIPVCDQSVLIN